MHFLGNVDIVPEIILNINILIFIKSYLNPLVQKWAEAWNVQHVGSKLYVFVNKKNSHTSNSHKYPNSHTFLVLRKCDYFEAINEYPLVQHKDHTFTAPKITQFNTEKKWPFCVELSGTRYKLIIAAYY